MSRVTRTGVARPRRQDPRRRTQEMKRAVPLRVVTWGRALAALALGRARGLGSHLGPAGAKVGNRVSQPLLGFLQRRPPHETRNRHGDTLNELGNLLRLSLGRQAEVLLLLRQEPHRQN